MKNFTHYVVEHGRGWSDFIGLCTVENGRMINNDFEKGAIYDIVGDKNPSIEPVTLWDSVIPEDGEFPADRYGTYIAVKPKAEAYLLPRKEAYHTDLIARKAFAKAAKAAKAAK